MDFQHEKQPSFGAEFGVHRADLDEPVRNYADNLHAQILELFEKLKVKSRAEFEDGINNGTLTDIESIERVFTLNKKLATVLERNEVPVEFKFDKRKEGWELLETGDNPEVKSIDDLELVPFLKADESKIHGEEMVRRAKEELDANTGQAVLEWLLDHQEQIPYEWHKFNLVAPGTRWRHPGTGNFIAVLSWQGDRWSLSHQWIDNDFWFGSDRLVRLHK